MVFSKHAILSFASLSAIAVVAILRKRNLIFRTIIGFPHAVKKFAKTKERKNLIDRLPDDILVKIVEFLPTRDAVRTSILSKRWRNIYSCVHHMDFCYHTAYNKVSCTDALEEKRFVNDVDAFLSRRSSRILSCLLSRCFIKGYPNKLRKWITFLGRLEIKNLTLNFTCTESSDEITPFHCSHISRAPSLAYLHLIGCFLCPSVKTLYTNYLEILILDKVTLDPASIACILSSSLELRALAIENCTTSCPTLRICGSNLKLESLFIKFCSSIEVIEIQADNLNYFEYFGCKWIDCYFQHVPKLENICVVLSYGSNAENFKPFSCDEVAKSLPPVSRLTLQIYGQYYEMYNPDGFAMFRNIRHLVLGFSMFKPDRLSVALVLEMCPVLYEFHLQIEKTSSLPFNKGEKVTSGGLKYHKHLEIVAFFGFSGTESEMDTALYIISSAMVLKVMSLSNCFSYYVGRGNWANNGRVQLSQEGCEEIVKVLRGHAVSEHAKVVVRPRFVSHLYRKRS